MNMQSFADMISLSTKPPVIIADGVTLIALDLGGTERTVVIVDEAPWERAERAAQAQRARVLDSIDEMRAFHPTPLPRAPARPMRLAAGRNPSTLTPEQKRERKASNKAKKAARRRSRGRQ